MCNDQVDGKLVCVQKHSTMLLELKKKKMKPEMDLML